MRHRGRHKCRPELRAYPAGAEPRNISVATDAPTKQIVGGDIALRARVAADDPRQVVMRIDQRDAIEQGTGTSEGGGLTRWRHSTLCGGRHVFPAIYATRGNYAAVTERVR